MNLELVAHFTNTKLDGQIHTLSTNSSYDDKFKLRCHEKMVHKSHANSCKKKKQACGHRKERFLNSVKHFKLARTLKFRHKQNVVFRKIISHIFQILVHDFATNATSSHYVIGNKKANRSGTIIQKYFESKTSGSYLLKHSCSSSFSHR